MVSFNFSGFITETSDRSSYFNRLNGDYPLAFLAYFLRIFRAILMTIDADQSAMAEREFNAIFVAVLLKYKVSVVRNAFLEQPRRFTNDLEENDFQVQNWAYCGWDVHDLFLSVKSPVTPRIKTLIRWFTVSIFKFL